MNVTAVEKDKLVQVRCGGAREQAAFVAALGCLLQYLAIATFATDASLGDGRIQGDLVSVINNLFQYWKS